jgi:hypothetical protein
MVIRASLRKSMVWIVALIVATTWLMLRDYEVWYAYGLVYVSLSSTDSSVDYGDLRVRVVQLEWEKDRLGVRCALCDIKPRAGETRAVRRGGHIAYRVVLIQDDMSEREVIIVGADKGNQGPFLGTVCLPHTSEFVFVPPLQTKYISLALGSHRTKAIRLPKRPESLGQKDPK